MPMRKIGARVEFKSPAPNGEQVRNHLAEELCRAINAEIYELMTVEREEQFTSLSSVYTAYVLIEVPR